MGPASEILRGILESSRHRKYGRNCSIAGNILVHVYNITHLLKESVFNKIT
jgi:hypothetical protein